jgi:hypothetical protein
VVNTPEPLFSDPETQKFDTSPPAPPRDNRAKKFAAIAIVAGTVVLSVALLAGRSNGPETEPAASEQAGEPPAWSTTSTFVPGDTAGGRNGTESTLSGSLTPLEVEKFVRDMYTLLPRGTENAWEMLGNQYADRTGKSEYLQFWSTIKSLEIVSITPRTSSSVIARLTYVTYDGSVDTEDRWVEVRTEEGRPTAFDSGRIGSV